MAEANGEQSESLPGICEIRVQGFKSLVDSGPVAIRPLTILAGANSSGKSSLMQPLLLMKQTLQAPNDPGGLEVGGPNVTLRRPHDALHRSAKYPSGDVLRVGLRAEDDAHFEMTYELTKTHQLEVRRLTAGFGRESSEYTAGMSPEQVAERLPGIEELADLVGRSRADVTRSLRLLRYRCLLQAYLQLTSGEVLLPGTPLLPDQRLVGRTVQTIHVPGLRRGPERAYGQMGTNPSFPGRFDEYTGALLLAFANDKQQWLGDQLTSLGLGWRVLVHERDGLGIEVSLSQLAMPQAHSTDLLVNLADVGFGVSQVLPVLVALLAAEPGQLVYLEQPELHLHPRAQVALAGPLVEAAKRGVRVVAETHSDLLLLAVQTAVAKGEIAPDQVMLHWFERDDEGVSHVTSQEPDETGAFADWPVDFGAVRIQAERELIAAGWE